VIRDDPPEGGRPDEGAEERSRGRGFKARKREDHALVLIRDLLASLENPSQARRLLLELSRYYVPIPGKVTMLQAADGGLLIGTSEGIWFDPVNGTLKKLSSSPVPNHTATVTDREGTVWFWTDEGLAKAMPFEEVTVDRLDPGAASQVSLGLVKDTRGDKIVVITKV
jgi:hypothetical protein